MNQELMLNACLIRLDQMKFTFGCAMLCGLFVPSLCTGACLGRVVGIDMRLLAVATGVLVTNPAVVIPGVHSQNGWETWAREASTTCASSCAPTLS